jgi:prepilin-type N-terminal cleavage/methylation domain-containing protein
MTPSRGFTLIELLLVISVIALLSSIIMSSFATGRGKAKDATVKRQLTEMRTLMAREFSDNGSYTNLKDGGAAKAPAATCTTGTTGAVLKGTYASNFKNACDGLVRLYGSSCNYDGAAGGTCLQFNQPTGGVNPTQKFSIYAFLPEESRSAVPAGNRYLCMGSNGRTSISNSTLNGAGCPNDPQL